MGLLLLKIAGAGVAFGLGFGFGLGSVVAIVYFMIPVQGED